MLNFHLQKTMRGPRGKKNAKKAHFWEKIQDYINNLIDKTKTSKETTEALRDQNETNQTQLNEDHKASEKMENNLTENQNPIADNKQVDDSDDENVEIAANTSTTELKRTVETLEERIKSCESQLRKANYKIDNLRMQLDNANRENEDLNMQLDKAYNKIDDLRDQRNGLRHQMQQLTKPVPIVPDIGE